MCRLSPLLPAFKYVLKTSFVGTVALAIIAAAGYALPGHFHTNGVSPPPIGVTN